MARWRRRKEEASFEDMPEDLRELPVDASPDLKEQRAAWLEANNLALVDLMAWKRSRDPLAEARPPSRRKWLSPGALRELDEQLEREPLQW